METLDAVEEAMRLRGTVMLEVAGHPEWWCAALAAADGPLELRVGEPRKRRHRSQNSKRQSREETVEDALDDFYVALPSSPAPRRMIRATEKHIDQVKLVHRDRGLAHNHIDGLFPRSPKNSS